MEIHPANPVRLNLGAGSKRIEGWISVDLAGDPDVVSDVRTLPFPDHYADEAQAIHVLEHIRRWEVDATLREWRRVLKPGGLLILELPDLIACCRNILAGMSDRMGIWGLFGDPGYEDPLQCHAWGWTPEALRQVLRDVGFSKVRQKPVQFHKPQRDFRLEARA